MGEQENTLDLVIPGLLGPVPESVARSPAAAERFPALERLLSRGRRSSWPVFDPAALVASGFVATPESMPAGPVGLLGAGGDPGDGYWYRVDPVHLRPDRDRLVVFGPDAVGTTPDEARAIAEACNALLREDGMELVQAGDHWYLSTPAPSDVTLFGVHRVSGHYMDAYLPRGPDARRWNALLSELQMLLHGLPLNQQRESAGQPTINGFWPWGGGSLPAGCDGPYAAVFADDDMGRGLARLSGLTAMPTPLRISELASSGPVLVHDTRALDALMSGDAGAWLEALGRIENDRFADLLHAVRNGMLRRVRIRPGCGRQWTITTGSLWRVWRRDRPLRHWLSGARGSEEG